MKGTLFSADFVFDSSNNARLLEINTDTGLTDYNVTNNLDFTNFQSVISGSVFDTLHIIFKPFQTNIVEKLEEFVSASAPNITSVFRQEESSCTLYVEQPEDTSNKFILRLAYDEAAILDSKYAKSELELYDLFDSQNDLASIVPVYISSSDKGIINSLTQSFNDNNLPDFVSKTETTGATHSSIRLYKLGLPDTGSDYRVNTFLSESINDNSVVTNYIPYLSGSKALSVRSMQITYGPDLDLCFVGEYITPSIFELPDTLVTGSELINEVDDKHRLEFTTNFPRGLEGVWVQHEILSASEESVVISSALTGSDYLYKSYFVSGSPDSDKFSELNDWYHSGSTFPSGSYITSSIIVSTKSYSNNSNHSIYNLTLETGDVFKLGGTNVLPVMSSGSSVITWQNVNNVKIGDRLFNENGTSFAIVSASLVISDTPGEHSVIAPNFEEVDTYIIKGSTNNLLVHNPFGGARMEAPAYCFTAGTLISISDDGYKNIEDLLPGDEILTYNEESGKNEVGRIGSVESKEVDSLVKLKINGIENITTTAEHPFYSNGTWVKAKDLSIGDSLQTIDKNLVSILSIEIINSKTKVYNLHDVGKNHNFYAHRILVHNK
jgi:hypothetical protein